MLDAIVMRCLRRRGAERWGSVTELAFALAPFGTQIAARALENAARILPLKDIAQTVPNGRDSVGPFPASARNDLSGSQPPAGPSRPAITAVGVSTSIPGIPSTTRTGIVLGGVSLVLFLIIVTGGVFLSRSRTSQGVADASAASASAVASVGASAAPPPPLAFIPLEPSASAAPIASAEPSGHAVPGGQTPAPQPIVLAPRPLAPATARPVVPPPSSAAPATSGPRPECVPPYKFDASGKKIWKRECV